MRPDRSGPYSSARAGKVSACTPAVSIPHSAVHSSAAWASPAAVTSTTRQPKSLRVSIVVSSIAFVASSKWACASSRSKPTKGVLLSRRAREYSAVGSSEEGGVESIMAGDGLEDDRRIAGAAGHRADVVEARGEAEDAVSGHPAPRGFETGDAIGRRRQADRSAGVRTQRAEAQSSGGGHPGSAGGQHGPGCRIPRVDRCRQVRLVTGEGAFGEAQLAEDHRTGPPQPGHDGGIGLGAEVRVDG